MNPLRISLAALLFTAAVVRADTLFIAGSGNQTLEHVTLSGERLTPFVAKNLPAPIAIAIDASGNLYVGNDQLSSRIEKYASDGTDLGTFASTNLSRVYGLAFDSKGNLYAANYGTNTVEKFSATGTDLGAFITGLSGPTGLAFDSFDNLYVANTSNSSIGVYSTTGVLENTLTSTGLNSPYYLAFDASENLYVTNHGLSTVRKFNSQGVDQGDFVPSGILNGPLGLVFDASGNLYVANETAHTINKFSATGKSLGVFANLGATSSPAGMARLVSKGAGTLQLVGTINNTTESSGSTTVVARRLGGSTGAVSVSYATTDGTALAGTDYQRTSGILSWVDGDTGDKAFAVPIIDAKHYDGVARRFTAMLSGPTNSAVLGSPTTVTVVIAENDTPPQPTIAITSPPDGLTVIAGPEGTASVPFAANINDPGKLLKMVQFFVNDLPVATVTGSGPYVYNAAAPPGSYVLDAIVTDTQGRTTNSKSVNVTVIAPDPNSLAPSSNVLTPLGGLTVKAGSTVPISLSADGAALDHVDLYANGELVTSFDPNGNPITPDALVGARPVRRDAPTGTANVFQTTYTLPGTDQLINMIAVAFEKLNGTTVGTVSSVASFHAAVTTDKAPAVAFSNLPANFQVVSGANVDATVSANDPDAGSGTNGAGTGKPTRQDAASDAVLAQVAYFLNGVSTNLTQFHPPFSLSFPAPAPGKYTLHAVATDGSGLSTVSDPVTVVSVAPPTVTIVAAGDGMAVEGSSKGKVFIERTGDTSAELVVSYKAKGSAVAGTDYKKLSGTVTIPAGASKVKVKIKPIDNDTHDGTRKVKVKLLPSADGSYTVGDPFLAKIKIIDND